MSTALTYIVLGANLISLQPQSSNSAPVASTLILNIGQLDLAHNQPSLQINYTYTPGVGAHRVHSGVATWNTARRTCELQGGHLAVINSDAEAEIITQLLRAAGANAGWIGVHDLYQEDDFVTILGQSLAWTGFDKWVENEPNNEGGSENCVMIRVDSRRMNDAPCSVLRRFVCEVPNIPLYETLDSSTQKNSPDVPEFEDSATTPKAK